MKILLQFFIACLLSSCASSRLISVPYDDAKRDISSYFTKRENAYKIIKPRNEAGNKISHKIKLHYPASYQENTLKTKSEWRHNTGSPYSKNQALFPEILTVTLKKVNEEKSKLYIDVIQTEFFIDSRLENKQEYWMDLIVESIKNEK